MQIYLDEIVSIKKIDERETIDITVDKDNLFFANNILTHNSGYADTDADMTNIADSFGSAMTADLIITMINTEEFDEQGMIMFKQSKNRFGDPSKNRKFMVGVDKARMKFYDIDETEEDVPVMNKTSFGKKMIDREKTEGFM